MAWRASMNSHLASLAAEVEVETNPFPKALCGGLGKHPIVPLPGRRRLRPALRPLRSLPPTTPSQTALPGLVAIQFRRRRRALETVSAPAVPSKLAIAPVVREAWEGPASRNAVGACAFVSSRERLCALAAGGEVGVSCAKDRQQYG